MPLSTQTMTERHPEAEEAVLGSSQGRHAFENCVERLATAIRLGVYPYGTTLPPERELAVIMGVSRATLREAIAALRTAKMVRTTRGRRGGTIIDQPAARPVDEQPEQLEARREQLMDSLVFRRVVEPGACAIVAERVLTEEQAATLADAERAVREADDPAEHRQADARLHFAIASLTGSPALIEAVRSVQADLNEMLVTIPVLSVNIEHSNAQHEAIVESILGHHPNRARRAMEAHCDDTAALLRGLLA